MAVLFFWTGVFVSFSRLGGHVLGYYHSYRKAVKMKRAILTGGFISLALLTIAIAIDLNNQDSPIIVTSIPYTSTPSLRPTPTPQPTESDLPGCLWWYELRDNLIGNKVCVRGYIRGMVGNAPNSDAVRIYLKATLPRGYRRATGAPKAFYFFDDSYSYPDIRIDDCITASGILGINNDGIHFMRLDGNLQKCP